MFVKEKVSGDLIRVLHVDELANPRESRVNGRRQAGEEEQDIAIFSKESLVFPSGEALPQCWSDPDYQLS